MPRDSAADSHSAVGVESAAQSVAVEAWVGVLAVVGRKVGAVRYSGASSQLQAPLQHWVSTSRLSLSRQTGQASSIGHARSSQCSSCCSYSNQISFPSLSRPLVHSLQSACLNSSWFSILSPCLH